MMRNRQWLLIVGILTMFSFLTACGGGGGDETMMEDQQAQQPAQPEAEPGSLTVTVNFDGTAPEMEPHDSSGNPECRTDEVPNESVVVNDNETLRWTVVSVQEGPSGFAVQNPESVTIDQDHCEYIPHITTVKAGQTFTVKDSDPQMHNVRATVDSKQIFNQTTFEGQSFEESFDSPGTYHLECNVHPWMSGWMYVTEHGRSAVTGDEGQASLEGLPPGDYTIVTWHEKFGSKSHDVTVEEGQQVTLTVSYSG